MHMFDCFVIIGQTVSWRESCRIKHLTTRLYLAVINNEKDGFQVAMISILTSPTTGFCIVSYAGDT